VAFGPRQRPHLSNATFRHWLDPRCRAPWWRCWRSSVSPSVAHCPTSSMERVWVALSIRTLALPYPGRSWSVAIKAWRTARRHATDRKRDQRRQRKFEFRSMSVLARSSSRVSQGLYSRQATRHAMQTDQGNLKKWQVAIVQWDEAGTGRIVSTEPTVYPSEKAALSVSGEFRDVYLKRRQLSREERLSELRLWRGEANCIGFSKVSAGSVPSPSHSRRAD
jgi:hypothetical protein